MTDGGIVKAGNFSLGESRLDVSCKQGHSVTVLNVRRNHYAVCRGCETYMWLGSDLTTSWEKQSEEEWVRNIEVLDVMKDVGVEEGEPKNAF